MKESEARERAEKAFMVGHRVLALDLSTSLFGHRDDELTSLLNVVEGEGWELTHVFQDTSSGSQRGIFRRREEHRSLR